jgi:hypothetical protein
MFTDFVDEVYNETGSRDFNKRKHLINKNFSFKFCEDYMNIDEIRKIFPDSKIILIIRDLRDTVYSTYSGNPKSIPVRIFPAVAEISKKLNISKFEASIKIIENYYTDIENNILKVDKVVYYHDIIDASKLKRLFDELFPKNKKPIEYYKNKIKKTPNQDIWKTMNSTQIEKFKKSKLQKLLIKYGFEPF